MFERIKWLMLPLITLGAIVLVTTMVIANRHQPNTFGLQGNTTWSALDGRFLKYSVSQGDIKYFLISLHPENKVSFSEQYNHRARIWGGSTIKIRIKNTTSSINFGGEAVFIVIDSAGRTFGGTCPLELEELHELVKTLANDAKKRQSQAQVLEIVRQFIEPHRERWPADLLSKIGMD